MKFLAPILLILLQVGPITTAAQARDWQPPQSENLARWIDRAEDDAIMLAPDEAAAIRRAIDAADEDELDRVSYAAAMRLLRAYHGRCCGPERPARWHIVDAAGEKDWRSALETALNDNTLDLYLRSMQPQHPYYRRLSAAYASEADENRRLILAKNLARWRWMPRDLGPRYLLVNAASQEVTLWQDTQPAGRWRTIVGKPASPTPVFTTQVTGVIFNPWWEIPSSIAAEGIAAMVWRNPAAARARGYVYQNGRYRQRPGDNNALGRMKLVMPNRFSVFLHDTSNRSLFDGESRTLSHGCVRVDRALEFAGTLLAADGQGDFDIDAVIAKGTTTRVMLDRPIPVYIAYFTAEPDGYAGVRYLPDIYRRDGLPAARQAGIGAGCALG